MSAHLMWALFLMIISTVFPFSPVPQYRMPDDRYTRVQIVMKIYGKFVIVTNMMISTSGW